jgi:hypothetical protein
MDPYGNQPATKEKKRNPMSTNTDKNLSTIDAAIAAAKARKASKAAKGNTDATEAPAKAPKTPKAPKEPKVSKPRITDEERAARKAKLEAERAERKAVKATARAAKRAEKLANRKPAHMAKIAKAAERLPSLSAKATSIFNDATTNLSRADLTALALHVGHFNRVRATERALEQKVEAGALVTIVGGDPRYVGKTGTVEKAQRIRCYVTLPGVAKSVYLFTSDVEVSAPAAKAATA